VFNPIQRFDRSETFQIISRLQYRSNAAGYARLRECRVQEFTDGSKRSAVENVTEERRVGAGYNADCKGCVVRI